MTFKEHEKFVAFALLGAALLVLAILLYIRPLPDSTANSGVLQILNMIIGAFISAFGAAAAKLFDARIDSKVTIDNPPSQPVPTADVEAPVEELPDYAR